MVRGSMYAGKQSVCFLPLDADYREESVKKKIPYYVTVELHGRCAGSCIYCYSSSTESRGTVIPTDKILKVIEEAMEIGVKGMLWHGGDTLLNPDWVEILNYTTSKNLENVCFCPNPMSITKKAAKQLTKDVEIGSILVHIDSLNQEIYNKLHTNPKSLEKKIQGFNNLLEAGFPPSKVLFCLTVTKPAMETLEETVDWAIDEMGAGTYTYVIFKTVGLAGEEKDRLKHLEPSLEDIQRAYEYRAKKLGDENLLRIGTSDGIHLCRNHFLVKDDGLVVPCELNQDQVVGSIYEESLVDIFHKNRELLLYDFNVSGYCGEECENKDVCFGCRANAYYYTGDVRASDPRCWFNPKSPAYYLEGDRVM